MGEIVTLSRNKQGTYLKSIPKRWLLHMGFTMDDLKLKSIYVEAFMESDGRMVLKKFGTEVKTVPVEKPVVVAADNKPEPQKEEVPVPVVA